MSLLSLSNVSKSFGANLLFDNVSFQVENMHKIGFVGANGSGKTTLFKIICELEDYDKGEIYKSNITNIGYIEQFACSNSNLTLYEELLTTFNNLINIEKELQEIQERISQNSQNINLLIERQHILSTEYENGGGYTYKSIASSTLIGLGFSLEDFNLPVSVLSGGQKTKLALAKMLLSKCNLILLDEPTNNLDINSIEWLENFLINYKGSFIVVSHDRYFLDKVTSETFELESQKLTMYPGNYSTYLKLKSEAQTAISKKYESTQKEISRIESIIAQQKTWSQEKNYKIIKNKQKTIDRLEDSLVTPDKKLGTLSFKFKTISSGNQDVLKISNLSKYFESKKIFENISLEVLKKDRVFIIGPNGCGKTTLLKIIEGTQLPSSGSFSIGNNMKISYYHQTNEEWFSLNKSILDFVWENYPKLSETEVRSALATFLFKGEDVFKNISLLSGGERARISLLLMMLSEANFLILDEPTNHLDIASREALEKALQGYDGTILAVSHDRYFINKLANKIYRLTPNSALLFKGNYDFYLQNYIEEKEITNLKQKNVSYQERKKQEAITRKQKKQIENLENKIDELEQEKKKLETLSLSDEYALDYIKAMEITSKISDITNNLNQLYTEWESLTSL